METELRQVHFPGLLVPIYVFGLREENVCVSYKDAAEQYFVRRFESWNFPVHDQLQ